VFLHEFHESLGAHFETVNGAEVVSDYGDPLLEYAALTQKAAIIDLSFRSRLCLVGADRIRFLHGQVTNDVKRLQLGNGCYAALVSAKGRMQSDLNIYCLADELLLDFEPGFLKTVSERLEKYIVADDVQVVDIASSYGLLSIQGPRAAEIIRQLQLFGDLPPIPFQFSKTEDATLGEIYLMNQQRIGTGGFDIYVAQPALVAVADKLVASARSIGGSACGRTALEMARIEAGIPRFGVDMDETNFPQECGIESRAVSYTKGCYIGQEVLNRIHTMGHVNQQLHGLQLEDNLKSLPRKGDKLLQSGREVGSIRSALASPGWKRNIALGYVRREVAQIAMTLTLQTAEEQSTARIVALPLPRQ
jgi:folate-binding protein YgfZ